LKQAIVAVFTYEILMDLKNYQKARITYIFINPSMTVYFVSCILYS